MNFAYAHPVPSVRSPQKTRSMGGKFFLLFLLAVLMSIPGFMLSNLAESRATLHHADITADSGSPAAPRTVLGIALADSYRSVDRSLKYITLFLGLVFLTYFILEITSGRSVHPAQYALVGVAQTVFYLLLLSLAEHTGFDLAFLIAGVATVALLSINTEWIFRSRPQAVRACAAFTALYAFIYVLLRLADYALLVGSLAAFAAIAVTMYATRHIDWYGTPDATRTLHDSILEPL